MTTWPIIVSYLTGAALGMLLLGLAWAVGWLIAPPHSYTGQVAPRSTWVHLGASALFAFGAIAIAIAS